MKIVLVNTTDTKGGAAVACNRLLIALTKNNSQVQMLVKDKYTSADAVTSWANTRLKKLKSFLNFAAERLYFALYEKSKQVRFAFSPANLGEDISQHPLIQEADIIHLHWVSFGFLSLRSLKKLFELNKPIVWTLHDMWAFTGGCHYAGECNNYKTECNNCLYLKNAGNTDLSNKIFKKKKQLYATANIHFVACSNWLATIASQSILSENHLVCNIANPIDTDLFFPDNKQKWRKYFKLPENKKLILFGAANINDPRKGYTYFVQALELLAKDYPQTIADYEILIFGKSNNQTINLPYGLHFLPYISGNYEINGIYNCADVFVLPSLEDNLPNTIMEALSCGVPVAAFNTGGIPEMIEHKKTGYLCTPKSAKQMADGIYFLLNNNNYQQISSFARDFVLKNYNQNVIAQQYQQLYNKLRIV